MHEDVRNAIEQIEAALFSDSTFEDDKENYLFNETLIRWQDRLQNLRRLWQPVELPEQAQVPTANYGTKTGKLKCKSWLNNVNNHNKDYPTGTKVAWDGECWRTADGMIVHPSTVELDN